MSSDKYKSYEIGARLGRGAAGDVHLATYKKKGTTVVIKLMNIYNMPEKEAESATREAYFLRSLKHPNVVRYIDSFIHGPTLMIVMEHADAGDLATLLESREGENLPEDLVIRMFTQIALGLKHVHAANVVHRDLKPRNIFLTSEGMVKIGDFGVAKELSGTKNLTSTVTGTPSYLSPQVCNSEEYDTQSDIWSLGCILYEMLTLSRAFPGSSIAAVVSRIVSYALEPVDPALGYSAEIIDLTMRMLAEAPQDRPTASDIVSMPLFKKAIQKYLRKQLQMRRANKKAAKAKAKAKGKGKAAAPPPSSPEKPAASLVSSIIESSFLKTDDDDSAGSASSDGSGKESDSNRRARRSLYRSIVSARPRKVKPEEGTEMWKSIGSGQRRRRTKRHTTYDDRARASRSSSGSSTAYSGSYSYSYGTDSSYSSDSADYSYE